MITFLELTVVFSLEPEYDVFYHIMKLVEIMFMNLYYFFDVE